LGLAIPAFGFGISERKNNQVALEPRHHTSTQIVCAMRRVGSSKQCG